jgi:MoxR-like ATPase
VPAAPAAAPATGPVVAPPKPGAVRRPGGDWYLPRRLGNTTDIEVLRRLRREQIPALLYGPPGTGKTALVEAAFADVLTVAGHGDACVEDLLGSWMPSPGGGFSYTHGPLVTAMRQGRVLFVDDATLIPPRVLAVLYPAMDGRATITIPAHQHETVNATAGFYVIAGHNPGVHGAVLTEALASRFATHIEVTTDFRLARDLGVPHQAVAAAANLNTQLGNGEISWAPQLRELLAFTRIAAALGLEAAVANLAAIAPEADRPLVIATLQNSFGRTITPLRLGDQP